MATDRGWLWHDFEDTCSGPVALGPGPRPPSSQYQDGPRILAAYRDPVDPGQLAVCERLRWLHPALAGPYRGPRRVPGRDLAIASRPTARWTTT